MLVWSHCLKQKLSHFFFPHSSAFSFMNSLIKQLGISVALDLPLSVYIYVCVWIFSFPVACGRLYVVNACIFHDFIFIKQKYKKVKKNYNFYDFHVSSQSVNI